MALTALPTGYLFRLPLVPGSTVGTVAVNAAGESAFVIGRIIWSDGASHVVSAAGGGAIHWRPSGTLTWANAGSNLRVGIQDVDATTGIEDATFDVYADLVPGTDTLTASTITGTVMDTGTKTIANKAIVAIGFEMTARGGADDVRPSTVDALDANFPYSSLDTGAGPTKDATGAYLAVTVVADDGAIGYIDGGGYAFHTLGALSSWQIDSTPDEYGTKFILPWDVSLAGVSAMVNSVASGDTFEICLYSDPLGTPTLIEAITVDPDIVGGTGAARVRALFSTVRDLTAGTVYGVTLRPTSANTLGIVHVDFNTGNAALRGALPLGTNCSMISRTDNAGAFTETTTKVCSFDLLFSKVNDTAGSAGGAYIL